VSDKADSEKRPGSVGAKGEGRETDLAIVEHVHGLALLGARRVVQARKLLSGGQKLRLFPSMAASLTKEGRPGFLLLFDITRTLSLDGDMTISEIADAVGRPLSTASRLVDGLEAAGLVGRHENPADGRSTLVGLTETGRVVVAELRLEAAAPLVERLTRLTARERKTLERLLGRLAAPDTGDAPGPSDVPGTGDAPSTREVDR